jgi:hypothetical protein
MIKYKELHHAIESHSMSGPLSRMVDIASDSPRSVSVILCTTGLMPVGIGFIGWTLRLLHIWIFPCFLQV